MLATWLKILPVFIYQWLARRHCEVVKWGSIEYVTAADDVLVRLQSRGE